MLVSADLSAHENVFLKETTKPQFPQK